MTSDMTLGSLQELDKLVQLRRDLDDVVRRNAEKWITIAEGTLTALEKRCCSEAFLTFEHLEPEIDAVCFQWHCGDRDRLGYEGCRDRDETVDVPIAELGLSLEGGIT